MNIRITTLVLALLLSLFSFSQDNDRVGPVEIGTSLEMREVPSLASRMNDLIPYVDETKEMHAIFINSFISKLVFLILSSLFSN